MNSLEEMENEKTKATTILPVNTSWSLVLFYIDTSNRAPENCSSYFKLTSK